MKKSILLKTGSGTGAKKWSIEQSGNQYYISAFPVFDHPDQEAWYGLAFGPDPRDPTQCVSVCTKREGHSSKAIVAVLEAFEQLHDVSISMGDMDKNPPGEYILK